MTTQDNELYTLCKEVYEVKPGWITGDWFLQDPDGKIIGNARPALLRMDREWKNGYRTDVPLYTSDFLLEIFPMELAHGDSDQENFRLYMDIDPLTSLYQFGYTESGIDEESDTARKALLKLTLELHKEKLLV